MYIGDEIPSDRFTDCFFVPLIFSYYTYTNLCGRFSHFQTKTTGIVFRNSNLIDFRARLTGAYIASIFTVSPIS